LAIGILVLASNHKVQAGINLTGQMRSAKCQVRFYTEGEVPMATQTVPKQLSIADFVSELHKFPSAAFDHTGEILAFLQHTSVAPDTLAPYLTWDRQHYTRNLIDKTPLYELIAICWEVGQASSVHNHRDQNCWMSVPIGRLLVENFHLVSQDVEHGKCQLTPSDTVEMNPSYPCAVDPADPVHRVVNAKQFGERAVSLHIYSRPFDTCVVYSPEQGTCGIIELHYNTVFGRPA
jgi:cysteine dioxygenase